jgi:hypothetical protein
MPAMQVVRAAQAGARIHAGLIQEAQGIELPDNRLVKFGIHMLASKFIVERFSGPDYGHHLMIPEISEAMLSQIYFLPVDEKRRSHLNAEVNELNDERFAWLILNLGFFRHIHNQHLRGLLGYNQGAKTATLDEAVFMATLAGLRYPSLHRR